MSPKHKLFRLTTVAVSMNIILKGQLAFMNSYFDVTGITTEDEKHFKEIEIREGVRMIPVFISRNISLISDLKTLFNLIFFFFKERPTIVHTHTPKAGLLGMLAAYLTRVPVRMHTVGGMPLMEVTGFKRKILNTTEELTYALAHKVYPNSKGLSEFILDQGFANSDKIKVLANGGSNGINTEFFSKEALTQMGLNRSNLREELNIQDEHFVFCFVGRFAKEKGMVELINVLDRLSESFSIKLLLVGKFEESYGSLDDNLKQRILSHRNVIYPGRADDVRPYYYLSDAFVFPSYREGFPNAVLEAGSMGLPSIVTDINGCNEIVKHGINGLLIPAKNERELEKAMIDFVSNKQLYSELASNARRIIQENFKREFVWQSLLEEYNYYLGKLVHD